MAKKKGRRSAKVARKREKRNRDRKSRQKQIAIEKQRRLPYEKSEKERLHACISQSRELLNEPELENVHFDFELMYTWVTELLEDYYDMDDKEEAPADSDADAEAEAPLTLAESDESSPLYPLGEAMQERATQDEQMEKAERAGEHFRTEVLPHLVTPEFMQRLIQALTACETRLKLIGNREMAEVALVARSLFEVAPTDMLVFHPLIQTIGIQTLRVIVEEPNVVLEEREDVKEMLSDVLAYETEADPYPQSDPLSIFSDGASDGVEEETPREDDEELPVVSDEGDEVSADAAEEAESPPDVLEPESLSLPVSDEVEAAEEPVQEEPPLPTFTPDELAARALYKNFNGMATREIFEAGTAYVLAEETAEQVEFIDVTRERYITLTEERLQLHARSEAALTDAMEEIQELCEEALMYLAKAIQP